MKPNHKPGAESDSSNSDATLVDRVSAGKHETVVTERVAQFGDRGRLQRILDWFYGYDYFISYRWSDGRIYALSLAEKLEKDGYDCFLDSSDYAKGDNWKKVGERALRKTSRLVLVGSPQAIRPDPPRAPDKDPVLREVRVFTAAGKRVIPINFGGTLIFSGQDEPPLARYLDHDGLRIDESEAQLSSSPSEVVLNELRSSFNIERQSAKRSRVMRILVAVFGALSIAASAAAIVAFISYALAEQRRLDAEAKTRIATVQRLAAQADAVRESTPQRSLLLSSEALRVSLDRNEAALPIATQSILQTLSKVGGRALYRHHEVISSMLLTSDDRWLITGDAKGTMIVTDRKAQQTAATVVKTGSNGVSCLAVSPDRQTLVSGSYDSSAVKLWKLSDLHAEPRILDKHKGGISALLVTPDGKRLITASFDGRALIWKLDDLNQNPIELSGHKNWIMSADLSPDGRLLATVSRDGTARIWDLSDPTRKPRVLDHFVTGLRYCAFAKDAQHLAIAGEDHKLWVWTLKDNIESKEIREEHSENINGLAFNRDGTSLATASRDRTAQIWSMQSLADKPTRLRGHEGEVTAVTFHPEEYIVATAGGPITRPVFLIDGRPMREFGKDPTIRLWDLSTSRELEHPLILRGHEGAINYINFSADGKTLFSGGDDGIVREWSVDLQSAPAATIPGGPIGSMDCDRQLHAGPCLPITRQAHQSGARDSSICDIAICDSTQKLATVGIDGVVLLWNLGKLDDPQLVVDRRGHGSDNRILRLAFVPDGSSLVTCDQSGVVEQWSLKAPQTASKKLRELKVSGYDVTLSKGGQVLIVEGNNNSISVHRLSKEGAPRETLSGKLPIVRTTAISDDGEHVVAEFAGQGTDEKAVMVWNLTASSRPPISIPVAGFVNKMAISAHGKYLLVSDQEGHTQLWNLISPEKPVRNLAGHSGPVDAMTFSGDEKCFATAGGKDDRTVRIWTTSESSEPIVLPQIDPLIHDLALDHEGNRLLIADHSGVVSEWLLSAEQLLHLAQLTAGRILSDDEWTQYFEGLPFRSTFTVQARPIASIKDQ